jgi:methylated-DNA-protein-cysteine methyltransferase-like protein
MQAPSFSQGAFFRGVYRIVRKIPRGKVVTYGQIATLLDAPYMARQVGWAMHGCPAGLPWHRVLGAGGRILINSLSTGEGPLLQRKLLELEGVQFLGSRVDMVKHQWQRPTAEGEMGNRSKAKCEVRNGEWGRRGMTNGQWGGGNNGEDQLKVKGRKGRGGKADI